MALQLTGLARLPLLMLARAKELGVDEGELLRAAGLTEPELSDPDARVELSKLWGLWRALIERSDDPHLGLNMGSRARVKDLGLVGYTMSNSNTLREALQRLGRYSHIISEALEIRFEPGDDVGLVVAGPAPRFDDLRHPVDMRLTFLVAIARQLTNRDLATVEVCFPYEPPADPSEYERFFRGRVRFDQPASTVSFRNDDLELLVAEADSTLGGYLEQHAESVLRSIASEATLSMQVRRTIWDELSGGQPTLQNISKLIRISPRTLQRRLRDEGRSFADLLDDLRQEMAMRLLRDRKLAIYEVAFLLGYAEPSTFHRAFRRWRGVAPHEYRRSMRIGEPPRPIPSVPPLGGGEPN
jgi:AraC-like DNA-binding protein